MLRTIATASSGRHSPAAGLASFLVPYPGFALFLKVLGGRNVRYFSRSACFQAGACHSHTCTSSKVLSSNMRPISTLAHSGVAGYKWRTRTPARTNCMRKVLNSRRKVWTWPSVRMMLRFGSTARNSTTLMPEGKTATLEILRTTATTRGSFSGTV